MPAKTHLNTAPRSPFLLGIPNVFLPIWATRPLAGVLIALIAICSSVSASPNGGRPGDEPRGKPFSYQHDQVATVPWSIHFLKLDRTSPEYELDSVLARGTVLGMESLADQMKSFPTNHGRAVGAINGDFYRSDGDPEGVQVCHGELVSAPSGRACFWVDAMGNPHGDEVQSLFRVIWPNGSAIRIGLNEERAKDAVVLYTPTMGPSTRTSASREYVLEADDPNRWLPLHIGTRFKARIREIREAGNTPLTPGAMVLSVGPNVLHQIPVLKPGDSLEISTATQPDMQNCKTAIGGGPRLVVDRKPVGGWRSPNERHPRTAVGWNEDYIFLVLVDGRQPGLSMGMSFTELADYFVKLGCTHAVNLDGGGSASMWLFGQTVSSPSEGRERPIANGLAIVKKNREAVRLDD
jgi:hypothetical protein